MCGAAVCHQGADVRSGTSAMPLPWSANLFSHDSKPLRPPNGAFIQTKPFHGRCKLCDDMNSRAGIHGVRWR